MATFKPGQLVKKVRRGPRPTGFPLDTVGVVVGPNADIDWPEHDVIVKARNREMPTVSGWWEPVLYDGNQASNWDVGVWKPNHLREKADVDIQKQTAANDV